jgi:hypothetical protein
MMLALIETGSATVAAKPEETSGKRASRSSAASSMNEIDGFVTVCSRRQRLIA